MKHLTKAILIIIFTIALHFLMSKTNVVNFFDLKIFDFLSKTHFNTSKIKSIVVVSVDEKSLNQLGQWPWNRLILAKIFQEILKSQPASLGIDVMFYEKDKTSLSEIQNFYKNFLSLDLNITNIPNYLHDNDKILSSSLVGTKSVLAFSKVMYENSCHVENALNLDIKKLNLQNIENIRCSLPKFFAKTNQGHINVKIDKDGLLRKQQLFINHDNKALPLLGLAMLMQLDKNYQLKIDEKHKIIKFNFLDKQIISNYDAEVLSHAYPAKLFQRISASDVLSQNFDKNFFTGKLVLFGATALGLHDKYLRNDDELMSGIFFHASFLQNALSDKLIYSVVKHESLLILSMIISFIIFILFLNKKHIIALIVFIISTLVAFLYANYKLSMNEYINIGYFVIPIIVSFFVFVCFYILINYFDRRKILSQISKAHSDTIDSMALVAESRDTETGEHIIRTRAYVEILALKLQKKGLYKKFLTKENIRYIVTAAPLHDIGKVAISDLILKKPAKLTYEEMQEMQEHPRIGKEILENAMKKNNNTKFFQFALNVVYNHHEKWDGSGYPRGLKGEQIPLEGRLMALADVYDALISKRRYKKAFSFEKAKEIILNSSGTHFDPQLVELFIENEDEFIKIANKYKEY